MAGVAFSLAWMLSTTALAQQPGSVRIERNPQFGRLVFRFDEPVEAKARVSGSVLIVAFDRPVKLATDRLPIDLAAYIAGVRADPDRRSLRIALTQAIRADLKDAAEELYLDLMPASWRGSPPPLPAKVVSDLARRARDAREAVKAAEARAYKPPPVPVSAHVATSSERMRISFDLPDAASASLEHKGSEAVVTFEGPVSLEDAKIRAALADHVSEVRFGPPGGEPRLSWRVPEGMSVRAERDGPLYFVDMIKPVAQPAPASGDASGKADPHHPPAAPSEPAQHGERAFGKPAAPPAAEGQSPKLVISARPPFPWMEPQRWMEDRRGSVREGERALIAAAAEAPKRERNSARLRLAAFYIANNFTSEALGVLKVVVAEDGGLALKPEVLLMRALAHILSDSLESAQRELFHPALATDPEAAVWRAYVFSRTMKHQAALPIFRDSMDIIERSPDVLQMKLRTAAIDTALAMGDHVMAGNHISDLEQSDPELRPAGLIELYQGRLAESEGRSKVAQAAYQTAVKSTDRLIEVEARLSNTLLHRRLGDVEVERTIAELETLAMIWRGGPFEVRARAALADLYVAGSKWRDAFAQSRRAIEIQPDFPVTRKLQDDMGRQFEALFLDGKADALSRIEALAIFDEFRALVPVGPRGDDIARKLAERLYDLDLIDQAAKLLAHQVQQRLKGVPRAEASARLAVMRLAAGQPQEALATLRSSRIASLPEDLRRARVLLEARILSELSRSDLALEVMAAEDGFDAEGLRADIHWRAKSWQEAAEAYERAMGDRWRGPTPLSEAERGSLIRAGVGYILAGDKIGIDRLRGKFLDRMTGTPDEQTFRLITVEHLSKPDAFHEIARSAVSAQTLGDFLDAYRKRFPGVGGALKKPIGAPQSG